MNKLKITKQDYIYKIELSLNGSCEASKDTIINKLNRIISDLKTITKLLEITTNISIFELDNLGGDNYSWDHIQNK